ncbi:hypothetical protein [Aeromicrobium sp. Leaf350]|uniref:hypothetical protein n=1 Tax=Aeromicrobium sp. Leaf350 TaxID=2876565 RepID=UPI001E60C24A|nr:hypothetical protein [Aeromicrobium sp. Leaf350]
MPETMVASVASAWVQAVGSGDVARVQPLLPAECQQSAADAIASGLRWIEHDLADIDVTIEGDHAEARLPASMSGPGTTSLDLRQRADGIWEVFPC